MVITDIETTPERVMLVVLANIPGNIDRSVGNYAGLQSRLADLSSQTQESLTFSTQVVRTEQSIGERRDNLIGYTAGTNIDNLSTPLCSPVLLLVWK